MPLPHKSLTIAAALLVAASGLMPASAIAKSTLVYGMQQEPTTLDPTSDATASIDAIVSHNILESLTTVSESGEVLPDLRGELVAAQLILDPAQRSGGVVGHRANRPRDVRAVPIVIVRRR